MRTTCPTCDTAYVIPDDRIGLKGRKVRCTKCGDEWRVMPAADGVDDAPAPPPPAPARAAPIDPFDALDDLDDVPAAKAAAGPAPEARPEPPPTVALEPSVAPPEAPSLAGAPIVVAEAAAPTPPSSPALRPRIRTKRRFARLHMPSFPALAGRLGPFVGLAVFLVSGLAIAGVVMLRAPIVAAAPNLAGLYASIGLPVNLRGLVFERIETLREIDNGQPVLVVEGAISNATHQLREIPALRFALRGPDTQELYAWSIDPKSTTIESGDTIRFRTRLAAPPDQATDIQVRFVTRRNQQAGLP